MEVAGSPQPREREASWIRLGVKKSSNCCVYRAGLFAGVPRARANSGQTAPRSQPVSIRSITSATTKHSAARRAVRHQQQHRFRCVSYRRWCQYQSYQEWKLLLIGIDAAFCAVTAHFACSMVCNLFANVWVGSGPVWVHVLQHTSAPSACIPASLRVVADQHYLWGLE